MLTSDGEGSPVSKAGLVSGDDAAVSQGPGEMIELNAGAAPEGSC